MSLRFWRRIKIAPGLTLNLSKTSGSLSFGPRGAKYTIGSRGQRATLGLPGSGLFYTTTLNSNRRSRSRNKNSSRDAAPTVDIRDKLNPGFFKRLFISEGEEGLVDGCRELALGNEKKALQHLKKASHLADGAYLAGFLYLKNRQYKRSAECLILASEKYKRLGHYFSKYGMTATMSLPITEEVTAHVTPTLRGVLLALVEVYQAQKHWSSAHDTLQRLRRLAADDIVIKLSLVDLLYDAQGDEHDSLRKIVRLSQNIENETAVHTTLLYYRAKALHDLGLLDAARDALTLALRRKKERPQELLHAIRYQRIKVYQELGQKRRARSELEKLYAESPDYADVEQQLFATEIQP